MALLTELGAVEASSPLKNATSRSSRGDEAQISPETEAISEPPHVGCYFLNRLLGRDDKWWSVPGCYNFGLGLEMGLGSFRLTKTKRILAIDTFEPSNLRLSSS